MRRVIFGGMVLLVLSGLTFSTPSGASTSSKGTQKHVLTVRCTSAATGHKKITKGELTTCNSSSLKVTHPCQKGSTTIFVLLHDRTYALRVGRSPERLAKQYGMGTITQVCGIPFAVPVPPATTTTTALAPPAPTTTTTAPPPPPTTAPPPPPTTTAPASCYPLTDGGNCYEPGEFCRESDHGATGKAGDGETITCQDNDGWRWEPT
jgi:hypothetical protein